MFFSDLGGKKKGQDSWKKLCLYLPDVAATVAGQDKVGSYNEAGNRFYSEKMSPTPIGPNAIL